MNHILSRLIIYGDMPQESILMQLADICGECGQALRNERGDDTGYTKSELEPCPLDPRYNCEKVAHQYYIHYKCTKCNLVYKTTYGWYYTWEHSYNHA